MFFVRFLNKELGFSGAILSRTCYAGTKTRRFRIGDVLDSRREVCRQKETISEYLHSRHVCDYRCFFVHSDGGSPHHPTFLKQKFHNEK